MSPKEHLISRLKALCAREGGPTVVADKAEVSAENLKQIVAGTLLPSGHPRGVGPKIQAALDEAFPGWSGLDTLPRTPPLQFKDRHETTASGFAILSDLDYLPPMERDAYVHEIREKATYYRAQVTATIESLKRRSPDALGVLAGTIEPAPASGSELQKTAAQKLRPAPKPIQKDK